MENWIKEITPEKREEVETLYKKAKTTEDKIRLRYDYHPQGIVSQKPIKYLEEYIKCLRIATHGSSWFRGQSKDFGSLTPKIYRGISDKDVSKVLVQEKKFFLEFRRRAKSLTNPPLENDYWSWYFLIQHYGGPTRLLDWTSNAAIALFMALDADRESKDNPIVYSLSSTVLSDYAFTEIGKAFDGTGFVLYPGEQETNRWIDNLTSESYLIPDSPIALLPTYSDTRIISQKSCFTLFGKNINGFVKDGKEILCPCCDSNILFRIEIDGKSKENLRYELSRIGVTAETVYPGLEGLNKQIFEEMIR